MVIDLEGLKRVSMQAGKEREYAKKKWK